MELPGILYRSRYRVQGDNDMLQRSLPRKPYVSKRVSQAGWIHNNNCIAVYGRIHYETIVYLRRLLGIMFQFPLISKIHVVQGV